MSADETAFRVEVIASLLHQIRKAIDVARDLGILCDYPESIEIAGERYSWKRAEICFPTSISGQISMEVNMDSVLPIREWGEPRVITRVMDDGLSTKDGAA